jgi:hypothetical protein
MDAHARTWRWRRGVEGRQERGEELVYLAFVKELLVIWWAEDGEVGNRIDEHAGRGDARPGVAGADQVLIGFLVQIAPEMRRWQERQHVRGRDDVVGAAGMDDEAAAVADADDRADEVVDAEQVR